MTTAVIVIVIAIVIVNTKRAATVSVMIVGRANEMIVVTVSERGDIGHATTIVGKGGGRGRVDVRNLIATSLVLPQRVRTIKIGTGSLGIEVGVAVVRGGMTGTEGEGEVGLGVVVVVGDVEADISTTASSLH